MKKGLYLVLIVLSISCSSKKVPQDATEFEGHHYKVFYDSLSWQEAALKCKNMGGMLAAIKSKEVNDFIYKLGNGKCLWLGASDELKENEWLWRDGSIMTYSNWASHEPDNWYGGKEHWLVISWPSPEYKDGKWGDTQKTYREQIKGYVCEWTTK